MPGPSQRPGVLPIGAFSCANYLGMTSIISAPLPDLYAISDLLDLYDAPEVVEVGSWMGDSATFLASRHPGSTIYCVDTWEGSPNDTTGPAAQILGREELLKRFCQTTRGVLGVSIFPFVGSSLFWASVWPREVDIVFIDANHDYEACLADIKAWTPHVRAGGIICGHDYTKEFPGVVRAVGETGEFKTAGERVWWRRIE
jgi:predicted O-methyltransferase YrrM